MLHDFFPVGFVVHGWFFLFGVIGVVGHGRGLRHFHFFVVVWLAFNRGSDDGIGMLLVVLETRHGNAVCWGLKQDGRGVG